MRAALPARYTAHTSCFRREAGSAGKDTRGLLRVHEFDKVELLAVAAGAEQAIACQEDVLARSESILTDLSLSYRILDLCTGDLGNSSARTWDLEAYAPGCDQCGYTGFRGRTAVTELLDVSDRIRQMVLERRPGAEIKQAAREEGMTFLRESALEKVPLTAFSTPMQD